MNKMQIAHEMALELVKIKPSLSAWQIADRCFEYADAMQAEADKRITEVRIDDVSEEHADALRKACVKEWQPDWSVAPEWANWWYKTSDNKYQWCSRKPYQDGCNWFVNCSDIYTLDVSPSFNYQGSWQNSLRKRPK